MRILADANITDVQRLFGDLGEVVLFDGRRLTAGDISDGDILLVRSVTPVDASLLAGVQPAFVGSATSGTDHLDIHCLESRQIPWAHAPGSNARSVAEYVFTAIAQVDDLLERLFDGGSMGIIGYGHIGRLIGTLCAGMGIRFLAYDPWLEDSGQVGLSELGEVLSCDVVTLHADLHDRRPWPSRHLLNAERLAAIPVLSLLINAGRGALISGSDLLAQLRREPQRRVVLDTWENEPRIDPELLDRCMIASAHIAGYSHDGKVLATRMLRESAGEVLGWPAAQLELTGVGEALHVPADLEGAALLRWLLNQVYDIRADDGRMRAAKGADFDTLRRYYPVRRELGAYEVRNPDQLSGPACALCELWGLTSAIGG